MFPSILEYTDSEIQRIDGAYFEMIKGSADSSYKNSIDLFFVNANIMFSSYHGLLQNSPFKSHIHYGIH
jgi:hypothetical protein